MAFPKRPKFTKVFLSSPPLEEYRQSRGGLNFYIFVFVIYQPNEIIIKHKKLFAQVPKL